jgi:hypothetical protein
LFVCIRSVATPLFSLSNQHADLGLYARLTSCLAGGQCLGEIALRLV